MHHPAGGVELVALRPIGPVAEEARGEVSAGIDLPAQLPGPEEALGRHLERDLLARGQALFFEGGIERHEVPQLVSDELAAEVEAEVVLGLAQEPSELLRLRRRRLELVVPEVAEEIAVELVAARLGDHVDDPADRPAILGLIGAGLHLHLLDELEGHPGGEGAEADVGDIEAIDDVPVRRSRGPPDRRALRHLRPSGLGRQRDAGRQERQAGVLAGERQVGEDLLGELGARGGTGQVEDRSETRDRHLLAETGRKLERQGHRAVERHPDVLDLERVEAVERGRHRVVAGRQRQEAEPPVDRRHLGALALEAWTSGSNGEARQRLAGVVRGPTLDPTRGLSAQS